MLSGLMRTKHQLPMPSMSTIPLAINSAFCIRAQTSAPKVYLFLVRHSVTTNGLRYRLKLKYDILFRWKKLRKPSQ